MTVLCDFVTPTCHAWLDPSVCHALLWDGVGAATALCGLGIGSYLVVCIIREVFHRD